MIVRQHPQQPRFSCFGGSFSGSIGRSPEPCIWAVRCPAENRQGSPLASMRPRTLSRTSPDELLPWRRAPAPRDRKRGG
jgi:hypothetical protein